MNKLQRILLLIVVALAGLGTPALAHGWGHGWHGGGYGWHGGYYRHNRAVIINPAPVYEFSPFYPYYNYPYYNYGYPYYYGSNVIIVRGHHHHHHH